MFEKQELEYTTWADLLTPTTAETLATYQTSAYENTTAVAQRMHGEGRCTTLGMWGELETHRVIFKGLLEQSGVATVELPDGVRVSRRNDLRYTLNFNPHTGSLGGVSLEPYDVVIERSQ